MFKSEMFFLPRPMLTGQALLNAHRLELTALESKIGRSGVPAGKDKIRRQRAHTLRRLLGLNPV